MDERIQLRDELLDNFKELSLISKTKSKSTYKLVSTDRLLSTLDNDEELDNKYKLYTDQFRTDSEALYCILHLDDITNHSCPICGNLCSFYKHEYSYGTTSRYGKTCENKECVYKLVNSDSANQKRRTTLLNKYGVEHPAQSKEVQEKMKQTTKAIYGVENASQSDIIKEKIRNTNKERYGTEYGLQSKEVQEKSKQTLIERYGVEHPAQSNQILEKMKQTCLERHGVENSMQSKEIVEKWRKTYQNNNGIQDSVTSLEYKLKEFLDSNNIKYNLHKEIKFMLENNIGIEINGLKLKEPMYNRYRGYRENGIRLIYLYEWELRSLKLWSILCNWIVNLVNVTKDRVFARKCVLQKVPVEQEKNFLNAYHLQGYKKSEVCLGLYYNNELIQLMSFCKPRYNSNYEWELLRLCTKYGYTLVGGANKLFKNFIKQYNPTSIISYCDISKFTGKVYTDIGFKLTKTTKPQITWYNSESGKHFNHSSLLMIGADKLLGTDCGKGSNNEDIVRSHGYEAVYNCGLNVYAYKN